jgi:hypothetical protein
MDVEIGEDGGDYLDVRRLKKMIDMSTVSNVSAIHAGKGGRF